MKYATEMFTAMKHSKQTSKFPDGLETPNTVSTGQNVSSLRADTCTFLCTRPSTGSDTSRHIWIRVDLHHYRTLS